LRCKKVVNSLKKEGCFISIKNQKGEIEKKFTNETTKSEEQQTQQTHFWDKTPGEKGGGGG